MRINKFLASAGVASRRKCDELIAQGRVKVNGEVSRSLGIDIKEGSDKILVDGKIVRLPLQHVYYKLNKPKGYITSASDELGRKTIMGLIESINKRVYPIGRLDFDTEGLLLLTDDGELTNIITHPKNKVPKTYVAKVEGVLSADDIKQINKGIDIGDYVTEPAAIKVLTTENNIARVELTISEGKNRQVKRMFEALDKQVVFLKRVQIGDIKLGGLSRGEYRKLNPKEMEYINKMKAKQEIDVQE